MQTKGIDQKYCADCAAVINIRAEICPHCGVRQLDLQKQILNSNHNPEVKSKTTAGFLAFFLGGIGMHKFYLGKVWLGIFYLLFCWTYIPAIIGLIEGLIFFSMSNDEFSKKYN